MKKLLTIFAIVILLIITGAVAWSLYLTRNPIPKTTSQFVTVGVIVGVFVTVAVAVAVGVIVGVRVVVGVIVGV